MGRKSVKEPRQQEIIKAFYKLAKKEGLEHASIAKTAESIGINPSLIIHYFKSRENLVLGLVDYILDKYLLIYNVRRAPGDTSLTVLIKTIDNTFSTKWNSLLADSVSYSCYALTFRNKTIKRKFKEVLDTLRTHLEALLEACIEEGSIQVDSVEATADMIFVLVDGAYYYLALAHDKKEYAFRIARYKQRAYRLLGIDN